MEKLNKVEVDELLEIKLKFAENKLSESERMLKVTRNANAECEENNEMLRGKLALANSKINILSRGDTDFDWFQIFLGMLFGAGIMFIILKLTA